MVNGNLDVSAGVIYKEKHPVSGAKNFAARKMLGMV